jgi:hypothetical protein
MMADRPASDQTACSNYDFLVTTTSVWCGSATPKRRNLDKPVDQHLQE